MLASRSARARAALAGIVVLLGTSAGLLGPGRGTALPAAAASPTPIQLPDSLTHEAQYGGLGGEGLSRRRGPMIAGS
jgi:hypothetical protein